MYKITIERENGDVTTVNASDLILSWCGPEEGELTGGACALITNEWLEDEKHPYTIKSALLFSELLVNIWKHTSDEQKDQVILGFTISLDKLSDIIEDAVDRFDIDRFDNIRPLTSDELRPAGEEAADEKVM